MKPEQIYYIGKHKEYFFDHTTNGINYYMSTKSLGKNSIKRQVPVLGILTEGTLETMLKHGCVERRNEL